MVIGIILAAGEGKRLAVPDANKTSIKFRDKPLVAYGVELFKQCSEYTYIVVGAYKESIIDLFRGESQIRYAEQQQRLGTGHALVTALKQIQEDGLKPELILVGYGDHMMFYTQAVVEQLIEKHRASRAAISLITTQCEDPDSLAWGRIVRDENGHLIDIVEQKDANEEQRKIKECNAGFYCFDFEFAINTMSDIKKSSVTGEYYINDFVYLSIKKNRNISTLEIPFEKVGIGVNTKDQLRAAEQFYNDVN